MTGASVVTMMNPSSERMRLLILHNVLVAVLTAVLLTASVACGIGRAPGGEWSEVQDGSGSANQSQPADNGGDSTVVSNNDTVIHVNPNGVRVPLSDSRDVVPDGAASLDAVTWTTAPVIETGALVAAGTLTRGARLSEPTNGEPSAFSVHYGANTEVMVELLPDLGATHVWDTDATVAPSEFEQKGNGFTIRAYSPLFMDVGPSDLLLRVWGYDNAGNAALLSVQTVDAGRR